MLLAGNTAFTSTDGTAQAGIDAVMHFEVGLAGEGLMAGGVGDMCRRSDASGIVIEVATFGASGVVSLMAVGRGVVAETDGAVPA